MERKGPQSLLPPKGIFTTKKELLEIALRLKVLATGYHREEQDTHQAFLNSKLSMQNKLVLNTSYLMGHWQHELVYR